MTLAPGSELPVPRPFAWERSPFGRVLVAADSALFYTTRDFDGFLDDRVANSIHGFLKDRFDITARLHTCHQVHGIHALRVPSSFFQFRVPFSSSEFRVRDARLGTRNSELGTRKELGCDALWADSLGVALGIKGADCLPVTLVDSAHRVVGNIHSGWRGAARAITPRTLEQMTTGSSFSPAAARAYLGPSIRQCCFEVGEEVIAQFQSSQPGVDRYVDRSRGIRPHLDLVAMTRDLLLSAGIPEESIHDSGLCTRCQGSPFHSYRRDRPSAGRNLAIVAQ